MQLNTLKQTKQKIKQLMGVSKYESIFQMGDVQSGWQGTVNMTSASMDGEE